MPDLTWLREVVEVASQKALPTEFRERIEAEHTRHSARRALMRRAVPLAQTVIALAEALEREESFRNEVVAGILAGRLDAGRMRSVAENTRQALARLDALKEQADA